MTEHWLLIVLGIGLLNACLTYALLKTLTPTLAQRGIVGRDINKPGCPVLPEEGGLSIAMSLSVSLSLFAFVADYRWMGLIVATTLLISAIGFLDHLRDLRPYPKLVLCALVGSMYGLFYLSNPAMPVEQGLAATIAVGISYSVLVNAANLLAGFNGLESGLSAISGIALGIYFLVNGMFGEACIGMLVGTSYGVCYGMNRYPASLFVGNSGTLIPASIFTGLGVFTGMWGPVLGVTAPHLVNVLIRLWSTGVSSRSEHAPLVYRDGLLHLPPDAYLSLIRIYLKTGPKHERQIVRFVLTIETASCSLMFLFL
jgi:UDP-N-acetylglucosamine--dolichyl-phosphate N-acetylglucosaminephosphotransferase